MITYWKNIILFGIKSFLLLKKIDRKSVCNKNFLKTKEKSCGGEATDFYDKEIPKLGSNRTCLAGINLDSALKNDENNYPQVFLKECK